MAIRKAAMKKTAAGLVPAGEGWFVVNAAKARWWGNERFGKACAFEGESRFPHLGINIHVLQPGQPNCMYHRESDQEDFLVLSGTCRLLIEETEVRLKALDFVHCPPGTTHVFVGAGRGPCTILMVGARRPKGSVTYPVSALALKHGAGVSKRTTSPKEAYADSPKWKHVRASWKPPRGK